MQIWARTAEGPIPGHLGALQPGSVSQESHLGL